LKFTGLSLVQWAGTVFFPRFSLPALFFSDSFWYKLSASGMNVILLSLALLPLLDLEDVDFMLVITICSLSSLSLSVAQ
jgi:hypothetical protein